MELDKIPLWRGDHVAVKQLAEDFARYTYLPRLKDPQVLTAAVQDGLGLLLWAAESFAYADSFDEAAGRYRGLRCGPRSGVPLDLMGGLLVKANIADRQKAAETGADRRTDQRRRASERAPDGRCGDGRWPAWQA